MFEETKVSVGRVVHYYDPNNGPNANNGVGAGPYAAIVTQVIDGGRYVNLKVIVPFGDDQHVGSVSHATHRYDSKSRYWEWPPRV